MSSLFNYPSILGFNLHVLIPCCKSAILVSCVTTASQSTVSFIFSSCSQLQTTGNKAEAVIGFSAKRLKVGVEADVTKLVTPKASDSGIASASPHTEVNGENVECPYPEPTTSTAQQESSKFGLVHPLASKSAFDIDTKKLDSCATGFRIVPPLPAEFTNVCPTIPLYQDHFITV